MMFTRARNAFGICALAVCLSGCGGDGGGGGAPAPIPGPSMSISSPTTDPSSEVCAEGFVDGSTGFGTGQRCCTGTAEELSGVKVTWRNAANGSSGDADQRVQLCQLFGQIVLCNHTWSASIPLALGDNRITLTATDTRTGGTSTRTITINKPVLSYSVSGRISSHLGVPLPGAGGATSVSRVGADGSHSAVVSSGAYQLSCVPNGSYALTPSSTINYVFSPSDRSVTVSGADVSGQDFAVMAFLASGRVTFANGGSAAPSQIISLSGSASASTSTDSGGLYSFLLPNGNYTLTPFDSFGLPAATTPPSRNVTVNNADVLGQDFVR